MPRIRTPTSLRLSFGPFILLWMLLPPGWLEQPVTTVSCARPEDLSVISSCRFCCNVCFCLSGLQALCRTLELPGKLWFIFRRFSSPRRICLKRLSGLRLPRFGIRVFLLLRYSRSAMPYSVIFGTISQSRPARDFLHPPHGGRPSTPLHPSAMRINGLREFFFIWR